MTLSTIKRRFNLIFNSVSRLVEDKYFFQEFQKFTQIKNNTYQQNQFIYFIRLNYVEATTLGIYREVDKNKKSQSLLNLLKDIDNNYKLFTYKKFSVKYRGFMQSMGKTDFQKFAIKDGSRIDRKKIRNDIASLKHIAKPVVKYRHKFVAHKNKRKVSIGGTINDLCVAIDLMEKLVIKYNLLLTQSGMTTLLAGNATPDLQDIFK